ncbi:Rossmann-like and DUF2520 domain-containing protein [Galbibacter sp.]|uniref:Rossmann-like and DUF2520 domain-containing protein n=1 Tax=Galbibacter sp. TaxID=2918471 RepID=UPI003A9270C1
MLKIVLLGGGNVAHQLFTQVSKNSEVDLVQWYNRNIVAIEKFEQQTAITDQLENLKEADIYIIAVSDIAIAEISSALPFQDRFVVHTSGNTSMEAIDSKNRRGVYYPLQSFSKDKQLQWPEIPLLIEAAEEKDLELLQKLAKSMTDKVYMINSQQRSGIHLTAVFVNNFVNHMYTIGADLCDQEQIPFEIFFPLINQTTKSLNTTPPKASQTGPAVRGDLNTISSHLEQLTNPLHKEIYKSITRSILNTHGREKL